MNYPKVLFKINKGLDKEMLWDFLFSGMKAGADFSGAVVEYHPELKDAKSKSDISKYVDDYYRQKLPEIVKAKGQIETNWNKIEKDFFTLVAKYFNNLRWPDGKYVGYVAINPIGPRFISNCTWQTPYLWPKYANGQIIHEMLHFIFFAQIRLLPENNELSQEQRWHLSEIFNDVIQEEAEFVKLQGYKPQISYPDHLKVHKKYLKIWIKGKSAKSFIQNARMEILEDF